MKKRFLLLIPVLTVISLSACKIGSKKSGDSSSQGGETSETSSSSQGSDTSLPADKLATFRFYLDYSHSDKPLYTMKWYINVPLGECPEEALITEDMATDPLYPHFLGYSRYSSSNDESLLWDFTSDVATGQTAVELYGIWVAN